MTAISHNHTEYPVKRILSIAAMMAIALTMNVASAQDKPTDEGTTVKKSCCTHAAKATFEGKAAEAKKEQSDRATCDHAKLDQAKCDHSKCDPAKCDPDTCDHSKCDPATCDAAKHGQAGQEQAKQEKAACDPAKCASTCKHHDKD